jgi:replication initiation and membrane attachment protein DnaB
MGRDICFLVLWRGLNLKASIAKELGLNPGTIGNIRAKYNIQNSKKSTLNRKRTEIDPKWLAEQKKKGKSDREISEELGCHPGTVFQKRKQLGIVLQEQHKVLE